MFNFKLLDSYTKEDKDIFFGRKKEVESLYQLTLKAKIILLYGPTGVGKSSLLQCGLANRFENWEALFIRREDNIIIALQKAISTAIKIADESLEVSGNLFEDLQTLYLCQMNTVYLVFDQFEELYISGSIDERKEFLGKIKELVKSRLNVKIVLSLREEYIAYLADSEEEIPGLLDFKLRVEKMNTPRLLEVVQNTAKAANITLSDESIALKILGVLSIGKKEIELSYLQVYFYKLYNKVENKNGVVFDSTLIDRVGKAKDVLSEFLEEKLDELKKSNPEIPIELPMKVLNILITDEATKKQVSEEELFQLFTETIQVVAVGKVLEFLDNNRILRILKEENTKVELAHDILARIVYEKLSGEQKQLRTITKIIETNFEIYRNGDSKNLLSRKQLEIIIPFENKINFEDRHAEYREYLRKSKIQSRRNEILLWFGGVFTCALILAFGVIGTTLYFKALDEKKKAELAQAKAEKAEKIAQDFANSLGLSISELVNAADINRWSQYQGKLNWDMANKKCALLGNGYRLPKYGDWLMLYKKNEQVISENWGVEDDNFYWTADEADENTANDFYIETGAKYFVKKSGRLLVRCVR